jgi:hypothetical protein
MGYYTNYRLKVDTDDPGIIAILEGEDFLGEAMRDGGVECKWYDHEGEMQSFSRKFPDVLFTLTGYGEDIADKQDIWVKYFKGGKMQHYKAKIFFPSFDSTA